MEGCGCFLISKHTHLLSFCACWHACCPPSDPCSCLTQQQDQTQLSREGGSERGERAELVIHSKYSKKILRQSPKQSSTVKGPERGGVRVCHLCHLKQMAIAMGVPSSGGSLIGCAGMGQLTIHTQTTSLSLSLPPKPCTLCCQSCSPQACSWALGDLPTPHQSNSRVAFQPC